MLRKPFAILACILSISVLLTNCVGHPPSMPDKYEKKMNRKGFHF